MNDQHQPEPSAAESKVPLAPTLVFASQSPAKPRVSIVLLDWSCRESFHSLDYLADQSTAREDYEVIWIEYFGRRPDTISEKLTEAQSSGEPPPLDKWIVLDMPDDLYYHKHLMYNVGIAHSRGDVVVICDSDAVFDPTFVGAVADAFDDDPHIVLHLDEVRNIDRRYYPFNRPSRAQILGTGAINWKDGKTTGLWDTEDPLHTRNYGACMCARREDLIAIGGADEHIDYLGHICGPYDMTFRLRNHGLHEVWHQSEFLYHVWHPGQDGHDNYLGPHDGRNMSTTALEVLDSGRVMPLVENAAIAGERSAGNPAAGETLIDPANLTAWHRTHVENSPRFALSSARRSDLVASIHDYNIILVDEDTCYGVPQGLGPVDISDPDAGIDPAIVCGKSREDVARQIRRRQVRSVLAGLTTDFSFENAARLMGQGSRAVLRRALGERGYDILKRLRRRVFKQA